MGCGSSFVKYVLFFFNLVVALFGLALVGIGVAFLLNWTFVKDELKDKLSVAPWAFIVIGSIMFIIAFFGCCGAIRESHCMVVTYAIFLLVIIIVQVVIAILLFVNGENFKHSLSQTIDKAFQNRGHDQASEAFFQSIEQQLACCGANGPTDYGLVQLPASCCPRGPGVVGSFVGSSCTVATASSNGCRYQIESLFEKWNKSIAGIALGVACIEVVGALFALCLANSIRNMDRRSHY